MSVRGARRMEGKLALRAIPWGSVLCIGPGGLVPTGVHAGWVGMPTASYTGLRAQRLSARRRIRSVQGTKRRQV